MPSPDRHDPLAALRQPGFLYYCVSRVCSGTGSSLLQAAIFWQVYKVSGSALYLGVIGLVRFLPALLLSLPAGAVADSFDRRRVMIAAQIGPLTAAAVLLAATATGTVSLALIYAMVFVIAFASAFDGPARQSLLPQVVTRETFPNAVTVNATVQQLSGVVGPALGGVLIATGGVRAAYGCCVALSAITILSVLPITLQVAPLTRRAVSFAAMREGVQFVRRSNVLLGAMSLDMLAVIFGGAVALLPVYATTILKVGATGYGVLTSSDAVGGFIVSFVLVLFPPIQRTGRTLLVAVTGFGLATIVFGLSRSFPLSVFAFGLTGAFDQIGLVMRHTTIQLATPDELRGRVSAVGSVFVGASNQIGGMESGFVAALFSATFSVVSGGIACLAVVGSMAAFNTDLRRYRIPAPGQAERSEAGSAKGSAASSASSSSEGTAAAK